MDLCYRIKTISLYCYLTISLSLVLNISIDFNFSFFMEGIMNSSLILVLIGAGVRAGLRVRYYSAQNIV
mgnify:CR=1 FL=1